MQSLQSPALVDPTTAEALPAGQKPVQAADPIKASKVPAAQFVQVEEDVAPVALE